MNPVWGGFFPGVTVGASFIALVHAVERGAAGFAVAHFVCLVLGLLLLAARLASSEAPSESDHDSR